MHGVFWGILFLLCLGYFTNLSVSLTPEDKKVFNELGIVPLKPKIDLLTKLRW
jgi:hypothetical protein